MGNEQKFKETRIFFLKIIDDRVRSFFSLEWRLKHDDRRRIIQPEEYATKRARRRLWTVVVPHENAGRWRVERSVLIEPRDRFDGPFSRRVIRAINSPRTLRSFSDFQGVTFRQLDRHVFQRFINTPTTLLIICKARIFM